MGVKKSGGKKSGGKQFRKNHNKEQILNMFKKSANLIKYGFVQIWLCSNTVAFKYGCVQIWSHSNMVALKYGRTQIWSHFELEHRTLKEWLRTHSPRVENATLKIDTHLILPSKLFGKTRKRHSTNRYF